jgi:hypothetical protein
MRSAYLNAESALIIGSRNSRLQWPKTITLNMQPASAWHVT